MKYLSQGTAVTALTAVAIAIAAGSAHADTGTLDRPADTDKVSVQIAPGVEFTGAASDNSSVLNTPIGTVSMQGGQVAVQNAARQRVIGTPLQTAAANTGTPASTPVTGPIVTAQGDPLGDLNTAWHEAGAYTGLAAAVGGTAGGFAGAVVGCPIGAVTLGSMATVMSAATLTVPAMIGGCLAGAGVGAAFGGMAASSALAIPVGAAVTVQKYNEIQNQRAAGVRPQQH